MEGPKSLSRAQRGCDWYSNRYPENQYVIQKSEKEVTVQPFVDHPNSPAQMNTACAGWLATTRPRVTEAGTAQETR